VECFAKRLQIQERMTVQIAQTFNDIIQPQGIGVIVQAKHLCMRCRGVKKDSAEMITSCMLGAMRNQHDTRDEFLKLCGFGK
jgi:GTP cyclohydrolase I